MNYALVIVAANCLNVLSAIGDTLGDLLGNRIPLCVHARVTGTYTVESRDLAFLPLNVCMCFAVKAVCLSGNIHIVLSCVL